MFDFQKELNKEYKKATGNPDAIFGENSVAVSENMSFEEYQTYMCQLCGRELNLND